MAIAVACLGLGLTACTPATPAASGADPAASASEQTQTQTVETVTVKDATGVDVTVPYQPKKVVALMSSYLQAWQLAGGEVVGTTNDSVKERDFDLPESVMLTDTMRPSAEDIMALDPDFVILSGSLSYHVDAAAVLEKAGIPVYKAQIDTFDQYLDALKAFTTITGRDDLYTQNGTDVQADIDAVKAQLPANLADESFLFLRATSSKLRAQVDGYVAVDILNEFGLENVASNGEPAGEQLLDDLSLEGIITANPKWIFIETHGDLEGAEALLDQELRSNPAWASLDAVVNDRVVMLPVDLFHFKPNNRWNEAYQYLLDTLVAE